MEAENVVVKVIPTKEQLLTTKGRVSCTEDGCIKSFAHSGALRMHIVKSHGLIKNESDKCLFHKRKSSDRTIFQFHCPVSLCQYGEGSKKCFSAYGLVKQHYLKVHAERRFPCSRCETAFIRECDLKQHQQRCGVLYRCGTCTVSYTTKETLQTHCKRQHHVYPEEYMRQVKHKAEKKQNGYKRPSQAQPVITIITQPMLLVPVQSKEPVKPSRQIQPKPVSEQVESSRVRSEVISQQDKVDVSQSNMLAAVRQDALIQTDIYGIDTLSLNKNTAPAHRTLYSNNSSQYVLQSSRQQISSNVQIHTEPLSGTCLSQKKSPPKKQMLLKRRISHQKDMNSSLPGWKKMKSSTGIQTSVSLTKKKGTPIVSSTQTTGDYIIETALRHANICIEKKTVASQVTPQKPCKFGVQFGQEGKLKPKPVLVDSFSQVKQQNIRAETSHNLAESQTMTDLPPSISTQTLQSYLVNLQERHGKNQATLSANNSSYKLPYNSNNSTMIESNTVVSNVLPQVVNKLEGKSNDNIVQIYGENLDTSVNYVMPHEQRQKQKSLIEVEELPQKSNSSSIYTAVALDGVHVGIPSHKKIQEHVSTVLNTNTEGQSSKPDCDMTANTSSSTSSTATFEENYLSEQCHMTDMEAQTMSASEFDTLLQSSGIFMNNTDFLFDTTQNQNTVTNSQEIGTEPGVLAGELDFLGTNTGTIDMNTQTVDLSLFEGFVPIDSNTQTGGEGLDFLDMVMTNMETQTLNDDDLASLGLLDGSLTSSSMQTLPNGAVLDMNRSACEGDQVGISVDTGDSALNKESKTLGCKGGVKNNCFSQNSTVTTSTSPCFVEENLINNCDTKNQSAVKIQASGDTLQLNSNLFRESDRKVRVQTETQTVSQDVLEPLLQTETQTQVESTDTDFETINMETQTTFEDLQQLCDWLQ